MIRTSLKVALASVTCALSMAGFASGLEIQGAMPIKIKLTNGQDKVIRLMNFKLTPQVSEMLAHNIGVALSHPMKASLDRDLPAKFELGMNNEPVLDQGQWGTCATFASSGAINAQYALSENDSVSQLCNLEVGRTVSPNYDGGWQGSFGYLILGQISKYGYMNMKAQHKNGCGGLKEYPAYSTYNGSAMSLTDFSKNSISMFTKNDWTEIRSYQDFSPNDIKVGEKALRNVKRALLKGYHVVFGTLLDPYVGQAGAIGSFHSIDNDVWVLTDQIKNDINSGLVAGHEIIVSGYDDNACATLSNAGKADKQCGLLKIRNSWGALAGDKGEYYMTYDHFKLMAIEAYAVGADVKDKFKVAK